jgi:4-hydroxy 2-oxovalerate aldolase
MKSNILDCTLRDGGYVNEWRFGNAVIESVIFMLTQANVDIIECGFLRDNVHDNDSSLFKNVEDIKKTLPESRRNSEYVAMAACADYSLDQLDVCDGSSITGIRVIFHDYEVDAALSYAAQIKDKGYKVFFQPMSITTYDDKEIIDLIEKVNILDPYAFYIVDTLGLMKQNDIERLCYLLDHNLRPQIAIGLHSHNNLQLSFSNAQQFLTSNTKRIKIVDASIYGMGRGAGNLSTELIAQYLNDVGESRYNVNYLLRIYDQHIRKIRERYEWGYSIVYYLAAVHKCHPNYAKYLLELGTLPVNDVGNILMSIPMERRHLYNKGHIEARYLEYQNNQIDDAVAYEALRALIYNKPVLLLAPGKSVRSHIEDICGYIDQAKPFIISVNHRNAFIEADFIFCPNQRRYEEIIKHSAPSDPAKIIITSNVRGADGFAYMFNYAELCNTSSKFIDNAAVMLLKLLQSVQPISVALAGMDGFSKDSANYYIEDFENIHDNRALVDLNQTVGDAVFYYSKTMEIIFLTPSVYAELDKFMT